MPDKTTDPRKDAQPMDPERLATIRATVSETPWMETVLARWSTSTVDRLLADRDYWEAEAFLQSSLLAAAVKIAATAVEERNTAEKIRLELDDVGNGLEEAL